MKLEHACLFLTFVVLVIALSTTVTAQAPITSGGVYFYNPCWLKPCHSFARCQVVNGSQAVCVCPNECPNLKKPVCGTDWKTYGNMCELMTKTCKSNEWTQLRYYGACRAGDCSQTRWHHLRCPYYSKCRLDYGLPRCTCPDENCPSEYNPVCATDGRTYRNACFLRIASCKQKKWLLVRNLGHCRPDPCRSKTCCCGAVCRVNETNYAVCECNTVCTQKFDPVCGSDGKTYGNKCNLSSAACVQQNHILFQVSRGRCSAPVKPTLSPCATVKCGSYYSKCEVVKNVATCLCPNLCLVSEPVCGSDGKTYESECILQRTSCKEKRNISVVERGVCVVPTTPRPTIKPCSVARCTHYAKCHVVKGQAKCICPNLCLEVNQPVCGSDGVTYKSECVLQQTSCKEKRNISVVERRVCVVPTTPRPTITPCSIGRCAHYAKCQVVKGKAKCICPNLCLEVNQRVYVCGSDGVTYRSECVLQRTSCKDQIDIFVVNRGACVVPTTRTPIIDPCINATCLHYGKCENVKGLAKCVCPIICLDVSEPVCGSDGRTYENECNLKRTSCNDQRNISVAKKGVCESPCNLVDCCCGATCKVVDNRAKCECDITCTHDKYDPICGSDGKTYNNECELRMQACNQSDPTLKQVSKGSCSIKTTTSPIDPCSLGKCGYHATCSVVKGEPKCICPSLCPTVSVPVCGSDGHTYQNECSLKRTSCKDQKHISVAKKGFCERLTSCPTPKICLNVCDKETCAKRGQICCCQGCSFDCTTPMRSFGRNICPVDPLACRSDRDCITGTRCCPHGCTTKCM